MNHYDIYILFNKISTLKIKNGKQLWQLVTNQSITKIKYSSNGKYIVYYEHYLEINILDAMTGEKIRAIKLHQTEKSIQNISVSDNLLYVHFKNLLLNHTEIGIWKIDTGEYVKSFNWSAKLIYFAHHQNDEILIFALEDNYGTPITAFDINAEVEINRIIICSHISDIKFIANRTVIVQTNEGLFEWEIQNKQVKRIINSTHIEGFCELNHL